MNLISRSFFQLLFFISFPCFIYAQSQTKKRVRSIHQVENSVAQLTKAMVDADSMELDKLVSAELSYGHSSGLVETKQDFIRKITSGKSDFVEINLTEQNIVISKKTAFVRHTLYAKTNDKGTPGEVKLKVLLVWMKQKKQWRLIARQAVKLNS